jgi:hypothetical protein
VCGNPVIRGQNVYSARFGAQRRIGYVARLKALSGDAPDPGSTLSRRAGGYLLQAAPADEPD